MLLSNTVLDTGLLPLLALATPKWSNSSRLERLLWLAPSFKVLLDVGQRAMVDAMIACAERDMARLWRLSTSRLRVSAFVHATGWAVQPPRVHQFLICRSFGDANCSQFKQISAANNLKVGNPVGRVCAPASDHKASFGRDVLPVATAVTKSGSRWQLLAR